MKTANIGNKVEAVVEFEIEKIEREGGIVQVSGWVEVEKKKRWLTVPLEFCRNKEVSYV